MNKLYLSFQYKISILMAFLPKENSVEILGNKLGFIFHFNSVFERKPH